MVLNFCLGARPELLPAVLLKDSCLLGMWRRVVGWVALDVSKTTVPSYRSVVIATRYGLDGPGIESRWGVRFSTPVQTGPGAHPAFCTVGTGSFPGVKRPGCGADHPPSSKYRGHERVGLYLYSPSGPRWLVIERTFTFFTFTASSYSGSYSLRRLLVGVLQPED